MATPVTDLRYPIGDFSWQGSSTPRQRNEWIDQIAAVPAELRQAVVGLSEKQLDTPYRPGGWSVRQVVHHVADSHMNSFIRFKLALTEDCPTIKPYAEARWAETSDARLSPVDLSLALLDPLHARWVVLLRSLSETDFARQLTHPEAGVMTLDQMASLYAWHGRHHIAHITSLCLRMNW
jgi:hypothetical protein